MPPKVFLLSPANCSGQRARLLLSERAQFSLAVRLRSEEGVTLGEAFSFLSGLYFRGKLAYARAFSSPSAEMATIRVMTAGRGLVEVDTPICRRDLQEFAEVPIDPAVPRYRDPLERDAHRLAEQLGPHGLAVLLGSIATNKYIDVLTAALGERLVFPAAFVGRGDMSRGGLMLRCVDEGEELAYVPVFGALRRGTRPEKLIPRRWTDGPPGGTRIAP